MSCYFSPILSKMPLFFPMPRAQKGVWEPWNYQVNSLISGQLTADNGGRVNSKISIKKEGLTVYCRRHDSMIGKTTRIYLIHQLSRLLCAANVTISWFLLLLNIWVARGFGPFRIWPPEISALFHFGPGGFGPQILKCQIFANLFFVIRFILASQ